MSERFSERQRLNVWWSYGHASKARFGKMITAARSRQRLVKLTSMPEQSLVVYSCFWGDRFDELGPQDSKHYHVGHPNLRYLGSGLDARVPEESIKEAMLASARKGH